MKHTLTTKLLLVMALLGVLVTLGCEKKSEIQPVTTAPQKKLKIALVQLSQNPSFTHMQEIIIIP